MKKIRSFEVMESFGMKDLTSEEVMEIDGGEDPIPVPPPCMKCPYTPPPPCPRIVIGR